MSLWQRLLQLYHQQKMPHALLLLGGSEDEKSTLISSLVQLMLCSKPKANGACGQCSTCYLYAQKNHPDMIDLRENDKAVNIEDVREITHLLSKSAHQSGYRVVVLPQVECLQMGAANALLKTLEEPPEKVLIVLTAKARKIVLPTLLSRCFMIDLPVKEPSDSKHWLKMQNADPVLIEKWHAGMLALLNSETGPISLEDISPLITSKPQEALYLLYYQIVEFIRQSLQYHPNQKQAFLFLDSIILAMQALSLPGINKVLLFESLFYEWQAMKRREML